MERTSLVTGGVVALIAASCLTGMPRRARACGGCFVPQTSTATVVTDHRMAVAFNGARTILWDQFVYSGRAEDFVWVLPVEETMTDVELADPEFFDELDAATAPVLIGPPPPPFTSSDASCGDDDSASVEPPSSAPRTPGVTVHRMETVGPYETVTISSESEMALVDWLQAHDYPVAEAIEPVIGHYVDMGFAFVVLRLSPGEGVQAMQPVRVSYPGTATVFPLRMISAGIGDKVGLLLWVFGEARYEPDNFGNALIDRDALYWNWSFSGLTGTPHNYQQVFDAALAAMGGRGWVTESAIDARYAGTTEIRHRERQAYVPPSGRTSADWAVALEGVPGTAIVTRLRTSLAAANLDEDLVLRAATAGGDTVDRVYLVDRTSARSSFPAGPALVVVALATAGWIGHAMKRRRRPRG